MSSRLGPDSSIHQTLSWIATLILANLIFVGLAVPVFTAGPGLLVTALVCARLIDSESTAILPALRSALGGAGVAASLLFLGEIAFALLLGWEWMVFSSLADPILRFVAQAVLVFVAVLLLLLHVWVWPMMAQRLREGKDQRHRAPDAPTRSSPRVNREAAALHSCHCRGDRPPCPRRCIPAVVDPRGLLVLALRGCLLNVRVRARHAPRPRFLRFSHSGLRGSVSRTSPGPNAASTHMHSHAAKTHLR